MTAQLPGDFKKLAILGGGSWGLTLAWLAAQRFCLEGNLAHTQVVLWCRSQEKAQALNANRTLEFPVPMTLPATVEVTSDLAYALKDAQVVELVVTTQATRAVAQAMRQTGQLHPNAIVVNCSKGVELDTLQPLSKVLTEELPGQLLAVLSGPTLAKEILKGLPTAASVASANPAVCEYLQTHLSCSKRFRLYSNEDLLGVELGGALKNVFAIASGYMQAKGFGENARASLITRGLAEMARLSAFLGADLQTIYGLSGLGDLLATCNSPLSRNYQVGYRLGQGEKLEAILADMKVTAEGVNTAYAVGRLAEQLKLEAPITRLVIAFLEGAMVSDEAMIKSLMSRKLKAEL